MHKAPTHGPSIADGKSIPRRSNIHKNTDAKAQRRSHVHKHTLTEYLKSCLGEASMSLSMCLYVCIYVIPYVHTYTCTYIQYVRTGYFYDPFKHWNGATNRSKDVQLQTNVQMFLELFLVGILTERLFHRTLLMQEKGCSASHCSMMKQSKLQVYFEYTRSSNRIHRVPNVLGQRIMAFLRENSALPRVQVYLARD